MFWSEKVNLSINFVFLSNITEYMQSKVLGVMENIGYISEHETGSLF